MSLNNILIRNEIDSLLTKLKKHQYSQLFLQPIEEVITQFYNYSQVIEKPIDLIKIAQKFEDRVYQNVEEIIEEISLMFTNCKTFNDKSLWAYKWAESMEAFFFREYKKSQSKIEKFKAVSLKQEEKIVESSFNIIETPQVVTSSEDKKIYHKVKSLFVKIGNALKITDDQREECINKIVKSIVKRKESFEQIYEDTMKLLSKNMDNVNGVKSYFSTTFRKLLRNIKEEQNEGTKEKQYCIKINLNESEEKREEKDKIEAVKKEVINFIENQKIPECMRDVDLFPLEPSLRKKINTYVSEIRAKFMKPYN
jgi:hypothetical protein